MPKVIVNPIQNLDNPPSAVATLNSNFQALQAAIEVTLSRDGTTPNAMQFNLDMNAFRILNLPVPVSPTEPARHGDIQQYVDQARGWAEYAEDQADRAENEADDAEQSADEAEATLNDLKSRYLGAFPEEPTVGWNGQELVEGTFFFNTTLNRFSVYAIDRVVHNGDLVKVGLLQVDVRYWIPLPVAIYAGLNDVDMDGLATGQISVYDGNQWKPKDLSATNVSYTPGGLNGANVQAALDDVINRTSLGIYDISFWIEGLMENSETLFRLVASREFSIPVGATGSVANSRISANAETTVSLRKNNVEFGTIVFDALDDTGVFTVAGTTVFNPSDILSIVAPASADTSLRDTSITLACRR